MQSFRKHLAVLQTCDKIPIQEKYEDISENVQTKEKIANYEESFFNTLIILV